MLALDRRGITYQCLAPDVLQMHVVNHKTGEATGETRNVLTEAARIARGKIEPLAESLVRRLMHAHERAGQRGDALRVFEGYRQQLKGRGAKPGEQLEAQWRALLTQPLQPVKGSDSST